MIRRKLLQVVPEVAVDIVELDGQPDKTLSQRLQGRVQGSRPLQFSLHRRQAVQERFPSIVAFAQYIQYKVEALADSVQVGQAGTLHL